MQYIFHHTLNTLLQFPVEAKSIVVRIAFFHFKSNRIEQLSPLFEISN